MKSVIVLLTALSAVMALPNGKSLISIPVKRPLSKKSIASYVQPIDEDVAYEITMQVTADSHVLHVNNLPLESVSCSKASVTLEISNQEIVNSWPDMEQLILFLDESHDCPHETPIYVSNSWSKSGSSITFDTELAKSAGVDGDIKILVRPAYYQDLYANSGYDGFDFDDYDDIVNRTKVYPYHFDYNINRIFDIGATGTFLNCEPCHVKGDLDLVMTAEGTILNDFQVSSYIGGTLTGSFRIGAGLQGKMSADRITLFRYSLPEVELPGIFYLAPSFAVYGVTTLDSDQEINLNLGLLSHAKDFHVTLMSFGHNKRADAKLDRLNWLETQSIGRSTVAVKTPVDGEVDFGVSMSIRPQVELGYKVMGYPSSNLFFALDSGLLGSFNYLRPGEVCPNHISGKIDARSSLIADIGFKTIMKEGDAVRLVDGCLGRY